MTRWKRIRSGTEWGLFFGVISFIIAFSISNKIPTWSIWAIILSRVLLGAVIGYIQYDMQWWLRGGLVGAAVNLPLAYVTVRFGIALYQGFWPMLVSGIIFGVLLEFVLQHKKEKSAEEAE